MAKLIRPKWGISAAISKGRDAVALMGLHGSAFDEKLEEGEVEQLEANVDELERRRSGQIEALVKQKSHTEEQDLTIKKLSDHISSIRKVVNGANAPAHIKKSFGIGERLSKSVSGINASANLVKDAFQTHKEWSVKAGITEQDIEALTEMQQQLSETDSVQEESKFVRKAKTTSKNELHRMVEDEVTRLSTLGALTYKTANPGIAALFRNLIPKSRGRKEEGE